MAWSGLFKAKQETRADFGHGPRSAEPGRAPAERAGSEGEQEANEKRLIEKKAQQLAQKPSFIFCCQMFSEHPDVQGAVSACSVTCRAD